MGQPGPGGKPPTKSPCPLRPNVLPGVCLDGATSFVKSQARPRLALSGRATSYGKTRMTQLLATAAFDEAAGRQSRCVHSMCLQAMHRKISNVERSNVACNVRMRSDLPPHFLQSATECPVRAVPRGGGSSDGGSLGVVTRLVPDLSCKMPLRARVDHGDPM